MFVETGAICRQQVLEVLMLAAANDKRMFPCPVCMDPREVRLTKKHKPYVTCDPCGIQVFVRGPAGIAAFERLVDRAGDEGLWARVKDMERRYHLQCPECGFRFWIEPELAETSIFNGSLKGFRCPQRTCEAIVAWESKQ
jgi:transcription elongation factor Elf1